MEHQVSVIMRLTNRIHLFWMLVDLDVPSTLSTLDMTHYVITIHQTQLEKPKLENEFEFSVRLAFSCHPPQKTSISLSLPLSLIL